MITSKFINQINEITEEKLPELLEFACCKDGCYSIRSFENLGDYIKVTFTVGFSVNNEFVWFFKVQ
jgi:hypothetical protein